MTSREQLDRLMKLRCQRVRLAQQALAHASRQCEKIDERARDLITELESHRESSDEREDALFQRAREPLSASHFDQWQNARADEHQRQAELEHQQQICHDEARLAKQAQETCALQWSRQQRAQKALERLQAWHQQTVSATAEHMAELEMEEHHASGRFWE